MTHINRTLERNNYVGDNIEQFWKHLQRRKEESHANYSSKFNYYKQYAQSWEAFRKENIEKIAIYAFYKYTQEGITVSYELAHHYYTEPTYPVYPSYYKIPLNLKKFEGVDKAGTDNLNVVTLRTLVMKSYEKGQVPGYPECFWMLDCQGYKKMQFIINEDVFMDAK
jgi:hypothetical protein